MSIDRKMFFDDVRKQLFDGLLTKPQVDGMERVLAEWEKRNLTDLRWLSYMFATTFHETGEAMVPVREAGSDSYLRSKAYWPWIGEGLVQVTWAGNAQKFGATKPGDCMSWPVALRALFDGMIDGVFTGVGLKRYFSAKANDPINARRIINGTDRAVMIAGYHYLFLHALTLACRPSPTMLAKVDKPAPAKAA